MLRAYDPDNVEIGDGDVFVRYVESLDTDGMREIEPHVYGRTGSLVDEQYRARISRMENGALEVASPVGSAEWLSWLLQIKSLEQRSSFLHCAAVERNGRSILFPSWGGVGKTALAKGFVRDKGWRLLGDDLVMVTEDGVAHGFPKPMVLYPYHRTVFPEVFDAGKGPLAPTAMTSWLTRAGVAVKPLLRHMPALLAWARKHNPQSVRVSPAQVFGSGAIAQQGKIVGVVWLDRDANIGEPTIQPADGTFISRLAGTTMNEFDRHCVSLAPLMCGLAVVSFDCLFGQWAEVLRVALRDSSSWMLRLPASMPVADVPEAVMRLLEPTGLLYETNS